MGPLPFVFCLVPAERAGELLQPLQQHFAADPRVAVIVDRRTRDERAWAGPGGRGERRAPVVTRDVIRALPAGLRAEAHNLRFVQRLEPVRRTHESADTAQLVERIRAGDPEAISELWWRSSERVRLRLRVRLGTAAAADAAARDALERMLDELDDYDPSTKPLNVWLDQIVDATAA